MQIIAIPKCFITDVGYGIGNDDAAQRFISERIITNGNDFVSVDFFRDIDRPGISVIFGNDGFVVFVECIVIERKSGSVCIQRIGTVGTDPSATTPTGRSRRKEIGITCSSGTGCNRLPVFIMTDHANRAVGLIIDVVINRFGCFPNSEFCTCRSTESGKQIRRKMSTGVGGIFITVSFL